MIKAIHPERGDLSPTSGRHTLIVVGAALGAVVLIGIIYGQLAGFDFVNFDDGVYVYENPNVKQGLTWRSVNWAFSLNAYAANWHPLTWLSHMADVELYGIESYGNGGILQGPGGHHLTNVVLHMLNSFVLFVVCKRMTRATGASLLVASLFAVHPMHVESVAWVAERKDVLSGLFWMLTLLAYSVYVQRPSVSRYLLVVMLFVAGLMSKPMVVTLPCVLLLLDFWPLGRFAAVNSSHSDSSRIAQTTGASAGPIQRASRLVFEKLPFFILVVIACVVTIVAQKWGGSVNSLEAVPFSLRWKNAVISYWIYVGKLVWPRDLAVLYPFRSEGLTFARATLAGGALLLVSLAAWHYRRRWPWVFTGWFWYLGTLVPVIGLLKVGDHAYADRYSYLPFIGIYLLVAFSAHAVIAKRPSVRTLLVSAGVATVVAFAVCTWRQAGYWKDGTTLFTHTLRVTGDNAGAFNNRGNNYQKVGDYEKAAADYSAAIRIHSWDPQLYNNRGNAYQKAGKYQLAEADYAEAIKLDPEYSDAYSNFGNLYKKLKQYDKAMPLFDRAIGAGPDNADAYYNRGRLHEQLRQLQQAIIDYQTSIELDPTIPEVFNHRGIARMRLGTLELAVSDFSRAIALKRDYLAAYNNRALVHDRLGNTRQALDDYGRAIDLQPDDQRTYFNRGNTLGRIGEYKLALANFSRAIGLDPKYAKAYKNRAWLLATCPDVAFRNGTRALSDARRACDLLGRDNAMAIGTLAAAHAEAGDYAQAVKWQQEAVALARPEMKEELRSRLEFYRAGQAYRQKPVGSKATMKQSFYIESQ